MQKDIRIMPLSDEEIERLCGRLTEQNKINPAAYERYGVKRGLRNADGTGVMAGVTRVCSVEGYYMNDGERVPKEGTLYFRGVNMSDIVNTCIREERFGFEEVAYLLIFGSLPRKESLDYFSDILSKCRELPEDFIEDMIMKAPSPDIMNKLARSVLSLYSYDDYPDDTSVANVLRQSVQLLAQMPVIMSYAYQVKRRHYYGKSMYIHPLKSEFNTAQTILRSIRSDKQFTDEEAKLLDVCLMIHAEHGGGNNSTFANRVLTSSGTDTYASIAAAIGALKGPRHGGANIKAVNMVKDIQENGGNVRDDGVLRDYLAKIIRKEAGDRSGLVYGMGHAVYTLSDPRAVILKERARKFSQGTPFEDDFNLIERIERFTPEVFASEKGSDKMMCANVDLYSGLIYRMLRIPEDLFTPLFATARVSGWSAHRIEELLTGGRIIRPAYKNVNPSYPYIPISQRK